MPSEHRYKYTVIFRDGTFYQGDVPPPEKTAWDYPLTHLFLSYKMTGTRIVQAYKDLAITTIRSQHAWIRSHCHRWSGHQGR